MLWVDKHRPLELGKMSYHGELSERLATLAADGDIPHLLFYGPSGAGKKTRIMALLRALYGAGAEKQRLEHRDFKTPTNKAIEVTTVASNYHIEINPSDAGNNDRYVVQEVIKEIAQSGSLHKGDKGRVGYKVVLLVEVDRLTRQAQAASADDGEVHEQLPPHPLLQQPVQGHRPLRSRCLGIRVAAPTEAEIVAATAPRAATMRRRNLRRAILSLEECKVQQYPFDAAQAVPLPDWEQYVVAIASDIAREQSPQRLLATRDKLYELLSKCIPADVILKTLARELKNLDDEMKAEAFVAKFMCLYKKFMMEMFA
ncbi:hypothetical protein JL722_9703 [Aureococcus anophagefferens]|nr:hypothetical protein JL722_9703 [Aureococcus anophagefferens]